MRKRARVVILWSFFRAGYARDLLVISSAVWEMEEEEEEVGSRRGRVSGRGTRVVRRPDRRVDRFKREKRKRKRKRKEREEVFGF